MLRLLNSTINESRYQENLRVRPSSGTMLAMNRKELENLINKDDELRQLLDRSKLGGVTKQFILKHVNRMGNALPTKPHKKLREDEIASCCGELLDKKTKEPVGLVYDHVNKSCAKIHEIQTKIDKEILAANIDPDTGLVPIVSDYGYSTLGCFTPIHLFLLFGMFLTICGKHYNQFGMLPFTYKKQIKVENIFTRLQ